MTDVFISYARSTAQQARAMAEALRSQGYGVWLDDDLPAHRAFAEVIEEQLQAARAVVVIWSAEAARSEWVRSEAGRARRDNKLVQLTLDKARLPMPFDQIQCVDLSDWAGDLAVPGWRKIIASVDALLGGAPQADPAVAAPPPPTPGKPSLMVLPFANLSGDADQDYFADGMLVEIVTALSRIKSIFVIGSGSSLAFKGQAVTPQEAARKLGVRYVMEGSVRTAGGRVRIAVHLVDADGAAQIWTRRFEESLDDVFELQDSVALAVAGVIEPAIQSAEIQRLSLRPPNNMSSYDLYLRALALYRTFARDDMLKALELLDRAVALDPDYGSALAFAARCHGQIVSYGWSDDPDSHRRQATALARRALKVSGDDPEVLVHIARPMMTLEGDVATATSLIDRALALNPGSSEAWLMSGLVRLVAGEPDLASKHLEASMKLDPMSANRPRQVGGLGVARFQQGRFTEAAALFKEWARGSDIPVSHAYLAATYGHLGEMRPARDALARLRGLTPVSAREMARQQFQQPAHRKLFLDGIALAEAAASVEGRQR